MFLTLTENNQFAVCSQIVSFNFESSSSIRLDLEKIIADLVLIGQGAYVAPSNLAEADMRMQDDVFVQHFPGADLPIVPVDTLLRIDGAWTAPPPPRCVMDDALIIC